MHLLQRFLQDESGATAIEYGLIAACIALAIIASVKGVSNNLKSTFSNVATNLHEPRLFRPTPLSVNAPLTVQRDQISRRGSAIRNFLLIGLRGDLVASGGRFDVGQPS